MSKTVALVAGEGLQEAVKIIKARKGGISIPELAEKLDVPVGSADSYVRRLFAAGLVHKYEGATPGHVGRPPMVWEWAGKDVTMETPDEANAKIHAEAQARKNAARVGVLQERLTNVVMHAELESEICEAAQARLAKATDHHFRLYLEALAEKSGAKAEELQAKVEELQAEIQALGGAPTKPERAKAKSKSKSKSKPEKAKAKPKSKPKAKSKSKPEAEASAPESPSAEAAA